MSGQAKDESGKKNGPEAFPWDGSSDLDPNVMNPLIDGDVAFNAIAESG